MTNIRTKVAAGGPEGEIASILEIESSGAPDRAFLEPSSPAELRVRLSGLALNMDPFVRQVLDGVVRSIEVTHSHDGSATCVVRLEFEPADVHARLTVDPGIPARTRVILSRAPLRRVLTARRIAVDAAHGGRDRGARGPINLEERHVMLDLANRLSGHLQEAGASVLLTRRADRAISFEERLLSAVSYQSELIVSLHSAHSRDPACRGTRVLYGGGASMEGARRLAVAIHRALMDRFGLPDRGIQAVETGAVMAAPLLYVEVEPVCLANPLEEALLRSKVFRERIAQAVRNGLAGFFRSHPRGGRTL